MLLVVGGLRNKEIASQLNMSEKTVKVHMQAIFRKLAIRNRTTLAALFARMLAPQNA
jgi:DNA-binding NarL/FixJ family response regulator